MKKKLIGIIIAGIVVSLSIVMYNWLFPGEFKVRNDEIALRIKLDVNEDIGLVVFDYNLDGHDFSGGISNADRTMIKRDDELVQVWDKEILKRDLGKEITSDNYPFQITFRIITEYVEPNFENVYPEEITKYLEPIEWTAYFGQEYHFTITGNNTDGYTVELAE